MPKRVTLNALDKKIQDLVKGFVFKKKIWDRARRILEDQEIIEHFGQEHWSERSCYTTHSAQCKVTFSPEVSLELQLESYGQFHENYTLKIIFNNKMVLAADYTHWFDDADPRRVVFKGKNGGNGLVLNHLDAEGKWDQYLSVSRIKALIRKQERERKNQDKLNKKQGEQPPREDDQDVAESLGVPRAR